MPDNQLRYQSDLGYLANAEKTARREAAKALERDLSKNLLKKHEARYLDRDRPVNVLYRGDGFAGYAADAA